MLISDTAAGERFLTSQADGAMPLAIIEIMRNGTTRYLQSATSAPRGNDRRTEPIA
ncbi:hypothetical protein BURKHO8Y_50014 [Burkholderia sp. 8Y]|nr:hypothetical protein BURKHO8Y_50014 [Burkholderia sp. 8Y]